MANVLIKCLMDILLPKNPFYVNRPSFNMAKDFDDHLNDTYGDIDVCGHTHPASEVWKSVDPDGYGYAKTSYEDADD